MFWKYKNNSIPDPLLNSAMRETAKLQEQTKCADCGAYIDKINPVKTTIIGLVFPYSPPTKFYCGKCKKPYKYTITGLIGQDGIRYWAEIEVDKNGKPLK